MPVRFLFFRVLTVMCSTILTTYKTRQLGLDGETSQILQNCFFTLRLMCYFCYIRTSSSFIYSAVRAAPRRSVQWWILCRSSRGRKHTLSVPYIVERPIHY